MTVRELLGRVDAAELAEWQAYERVSGHLGDEWPIELLTEIHELLQVANRLAGAHFKENPAPEFQPVPRPPFDEED